jgi:hypothetical protein
MKKIIALFTACLFMMGLSVSFANAPFQFPQQNQQQKENKPPKPHKEKPAKKLPSKENMPPQQ